MKILFIQSYLGRKEPSVMPLGILMVATMLKDHEVAVYDPNISNDPYGGLKKKLAEFRPDVVGISIRNIDNQQGVDFFYYFNTLRPTLAIIKETAPKARVMAGGAGFSIFAKIIMERVSDIDYGVYLEGEEA
ncbi:MAG: cobalamin B12-binding domain-containing protein, partial [Deltaproteobacteria bacterium]|nr:cobalamin B12-binding domain-containing protein [Deltaproteobacteria bacterium]